MAAGAGWGQVPGLTAELRWRDGVYCLGEGAATAVVVLHEIYGVNGHIRETAARLAAGGVAAYCPDFLGKVYGYDQEAAAYAHYMTAVGFGAASDRAGELAARLTARYRRVFLLGYSAGATVAWLCSAGGRYAGMIGYYGSRIRDYTDVSPACPALLFFPRRERSFSVDSLARRLRTKAGVEVRTLGEEHGFADRYSRFYDAAAAAVAWREAAVFMGMKVDG